jgi:hypothetical protein
LRHRKLSSNVRYIISQKSEKKKLIYSTAEARDHLHAIYILVFFKFVSVFSRFVMGVDGGEAFSTVPVSEQASGLDELAHIVYPLGRGWKAIK